MMNKRKFSLKIKPKLFLFSRSKDETDYKREHNRSKIFSTLEKHENDTQETIYSLSHGTPYEVQTNEDNLSCLESNVDFSIEGFSQLSLTSSNNANSDVDFIDEKEIGKINEHNAYYNFNFYEKEHYNFIGTTLSLEYFIISLKFEETTESYFTRYILRNKNGNQNGMVKLLNANNFSIIEIVTLIDRSLSIAKLCPILHPMATHMLLNYDKDLSKKTFTFAIIYQKYNQLTEKEIFGNIEHSDEFEHFINFIGKKIKLKDFEGFRGGLDILNNETGEYSIYEKHQSSEIMFHVSTLLPHSKKDEQQLEKKRHIGNDRVAIVFQDKSCHFSPTMINSKLLQVFIVIQPVIGENYGYKKYKITIISRRGVPYFEPFLRKPYIFYATENLKKFLLSKLINAEYASLKSTAFNEFNKKSVISSLERLYFKLEKMTKEFIPHMTMNNELVEMQFKDQTRRNDSLVSQEMSYDDDKSEFETSRISHNTIHEDIEVSNVKTALYTRYRSLSIDESYLNKKLNKQLFSRVQAKFHSNDDLKDNFQNEKFEKNIKT